MFAINEVIAAFIFGWVTCAGSVMLGGWLQKIETRLEFVKHKDRNRNNKLRDYKRQDGIAMENQLNGSENCG